MGAWSKDSKSHVASMSDKDFFGSDESMTVTGATKVAIEFVGKEGAVKVLLSLCAARKRDHRYQRDEQKSADCLL